MKTTIFALAALFGLGLSLAVMGVSHGLLILVALLPFCAVAALIWALADRRPTATGIRVPPSARILQSLSRRIAPLPAALRSRTARITRPPLTPVLSVLMGLALGAALARDSADLPAALLCGALAGALHLMAFHPARPAAPKTPAPDRISDHTQTHLTRLITALAPCRDPHLHVAARALRREALALAAHVDRDPTRLPQAHRALLLWLPALSDAAEHLRLQHGTGPDAAPTSRLCAELTATLTRVATHLASLAPQPDSPLAPLPRLDARTQGHATV